VSNLTRHFLNSPCRSGTLALWHTARVLPAKAGSYGVSSSEPRVPSPDLSTLARLRREAATARSRHSPRELRCGRRRTPL
jgi:hypothetical protein